MKDTKENGFLELNDEKMNQVSGGILGGRTPTVSKKGWVCKNCGNVQVTWEEGGVCVLVPEEPIMCSNCGSRNSFEIRYL